MSFDTETKLLGDLISYKKGFAFKSTDYKDEGVAVIRVSNFVENSISPSDLKYVSKQIANANAAVSLKEHDIIVATVGSWPTNPLSVVGRTISVPAWVSGSLMNQNSVIIRAISPHFFDQKFIYYQMKSAAFSSHVISKAQGSANQASITLDAIFSYPLWWPEDKAVRRSAVEILFAIDSRIDLLHETNATLEAIAQALFKSWFVDFDPVLAKSKGKLPEGMDEAIAALFPNAFEETELGMVPRRWQVVTVGDVAEIVKGKSYSSKDLVEKHSTALVTLKSFERGGGFRMDGFKPYQGAYKPNQVVNAGDLIVAYTDVTQAAELIGKPALVVAVEEHDTLVASLDVGIVRPNPSNCGKQFLFGLFKNHDFQQHTFAHTSGTTVLHLSKDGVGSYSFALPTKELCNRFEQVALALADRRQTNTDEMRTLGLLRDTLLPRLISGQLRIADVEAEIEKVSA